VRRLLAALLLLLAATPAAAESVDVQLVLAVDVSRSVDDEEFEMQRAGYADALKDPRVLATILSGPRGAIGVTYMEWANAHLQRQVVKWTRISDGESAALFAEAILAAPRSYAGWTSISGAIDYAVRLFELSPFQSERMVIDVSGDGSNNSGRPVQEARDDALKLGITINGLPIVNERPSPWLPAEPNLDEYYLKNVIGGPGSFMIVAEDFMSFQNAILNKLIREIAAVPVAAGDLAELR
jgi:hypothetical protein